MSRCAQKKIGVPPSPRPGRRQSRFPIVEPIAGAAVVLVDLEPERAQLREHAVGDRALLARRARDRGELEEERQHR